jgi:SAM-dependent methyltransferase
MTGAAIVSSAAREQWHAWLDHPRITARYRERALVDGVPWDAWVARRIGETPARSLELGCASGARSFQLFEQRRSRSIDGVDADEALIAEAERARGRAGAPGDFRVADLNACRLPSAAYDLVFASHTLHRVAALESLLDQVHAALSPRGMVVIEGYVGPSRFQWTDAQIDRSKAALASIPERLRVTRWGAVKTWEDRPDRATVAKQSAFEAIRSGEIGRVLQERFAIAAVRPLGGTLQNLVYSGIVHNFDESDAEACAVLDRVAQEEETLIETGVLASDYTLLIGRRR